MRQQNTSFNYELILYSLKMILLDSQIINSLRQNFYMQTEETLQREFLPKLREKIASQFEPAEAESSESEESQRNFIIRFAIKIKNLVENTVAFILTMVFFVPLWIFKIGLNGLDLIERAIRFVVWLYVKVFILMINFVFKLLTFFKITSAVDFFKKIAKTYLSSYSSETLDHQVDNVTTRQLLISKKQHQLIDVKKIQKKIKTPNIFIAHEQSQKATFLDPLREQYRDRINEEFVPQRTVQQNIVQPSHRIKNPQLMGLTESHLRLKRVSTEPRLNASANLQLQIPPLNRQNTTPLSQSHRIEPDRDTSPSFYQKENFQITQSSFKKKQTPEKEILLTHHHSIIQGSPTEKKELQIQLINLRTKMSELIDQNNKDIHDLERWIKEKSQTILMTRKQNMELLTQIQQLQKENIKKTKTFVEFEEKVREMEKIIEKQRNIKNGLNEQVQKLEEEIKVKTIEIMSLKEKIRTNFEHLQKMQSIFGPERQQLEKSPFKQDYPLEIQAPEVENDSSKPLIYDLQTKEKPQQVQQYPSYLNLSQHEDSNVKTIGQSLNEQEIQQVSETPIVQVGSEKDIVEAPGFEEQSKHETKSTSALDQHAQQSLEEKIIEEEQIVEKMAQKVQETLKKEEEKLKYFEIDKSTLLENILEKPKHLKEPKLMQEEKPAEWPLQQNQKNQEKRKQQIQEPIIQSEFRNKKNKKKNKGKYQNR